MNVGQRLQERFRKALREYRLIDDGDKILVGLSGGKDSLCLLELLARQSKIFFPRFSVEALHVRMENIQYETDTTYLQHFCDELDVPLHIITTRFETEKEGVKPKPACFLCSWQRRKQLFNLAQEIRCNKIALGHHQDDMIHTALMNLTFQGHFSSMPPSLKMEKMPLTIIRPLCLCEEADIMEYAAQQGYQKQLKQCPYEHDTNRTSVQGLLERMRQLNPEARHSIWNALESVFKTSALILLLLTLAVPVSAQRRKKTQKKVEPPTEQTERMTQMTMATQRIMFIDSVVVEKKDFLKAYHLSAETGRIATYSTFFPKQDSQAFTFMNALGNRCFYTDNDSTVYTQERLQHQWTDADSLPGINSDRLLQQVNYPFMMPDGMTLYLAAKGAESIGGYDIFMTTYDAAEGRFLKPENIGMPFNSTANDYLFAIDEYNQLGFFASDRNQPDSLVCVYTFIPAKKYLTYDESQYTPEQIASYARIDSISMTWDDKLALQKAVKRLKQAKKHSASAMAAFDFVINDRLTYHHLKNFKAAGNQGRYQELVKMRQRYDTVIMALEKARRYYPKTKGEERKALAQEIRGHEQSQHQLYLAIRQQEKMIRKAENEYLTKNK